MRNTEAYFNVAGIEIENSYYADVYDNVAENNTAGILVFDLPDLPNKVENLSEFLIIFHQTTIQKILLQKEILSDKCQKELD